MGRGGGEREMGRGEDGNREREGEEGKKLTLACVLHIFNILTKLQKDSACCSKVSKRL